MKLLDIKLYEVNGKKFATLGVSYDCPDCV